MNGEGGVGRGEASSDSGEKKGKERNERGYGGLGRGRRRNVSGCGGRDMHTVCENVEVKGEEISERRKGVLCVLWC